jgi:mannose-6-phosphate isomerase-like protein (cupin superfamily)
MDDLAEELVLATDEQPAEQWDDPVRGRLRFITLFSGHSTPTRELTTGLAIVPPGGWMGLHRHTVAETYFVLEGSGIVRLGQRDVRLEPGSTVFVPGDTEHGVRNDGEKDLRVYYAFAAHSLDDIQYRFTERGRDSSPSGQ